MCFRGGGRGRRRRGAGQRGGGGRPARGRRLRAAAFGSDEVRRALGDGGRRGWRRRGSGLLPRSRSDREGGRGGGRGGLARVWGGGGGKGGGGLAGFGGGGVDKGREGRMGPACWAEAQWGGLSLFFSFFVVSVFAVSL